MDAMILLFYLFLLISSFPRGFALDNCTELQRHKRLARNGDYIGCHDLGCLNLQHNVSFPENLGTTPESCAARCGDKGFILAYVYQGSGCSCSCDGECLENPVEDFRCGLPCRQDVNIFCGGLNTSAVYKVKLAETPKNEKCLTANENTTTTGGGLTYPKSSSVNRFLFIGISFLVVIIVFLVVTIVVIIRTRKRGTHRPSSPPRPPSESASSERAINHDHQNTSRYEPAALLRNQPIPQPLSLTANDSTSHLDSLSRRRVDCDTGSNIYFTLEAEDGQDEARAGGIRDTEYQSEGTAEYAYVDLAVSSTSFRREMVEKKGADDDSKMDEDGMVVNDLYAMPHKTRRI